MVRFVTTSNLLLIAPRPRPSRRLRASLFVLILSALGLSGCSRESRPAPGDITRGAWAGVGGPDTFLFDLKGSSPDSLAGTVHVMRDGKMDSELTITRASYRAPDLEMYVGSTNATYRGRVDLAEGRVSGGLTFGARPSTKMDLRWVDPAGLPGFAALPDNEPYTYRKPTAAADGWRTGTPEEVGLSGSAVDSLVSAVARGEAGLLHSLLIVRHGTLVLEEYFHGYTSTDLHRMASATKSLSSFLVGAAIDRGLISGVEAPLAQLLGQPAGALGPGWDAETLGDLLTMSMGLDWSAEEAEGVHGTGPEFFRKVLARKVAVTPGTKWDYVSANVDLLAGVIFNATGKHAEAFAQGVLFAPLGITAYGWDYGKEAGYNLMDGSLQLRPRDMAKVGALVAAGGSWGGRQVISERWIRESTTSHMATGQPLGGYGYLWWTGEMPAGRGTEPIVVANGWGSQFIIVFPHLDMVVVTTGGNDNNGRHLDVGPVLQRTLLAGM